MSALSRYPEVTTDRLHSFVDGLTNRTLILVIDEGIDQTGVMHAGIVWTDRGVLKSGCTELAHVSPELDAAFCSACGWQCRISGAWFMDLWHAHPESGDSGDGS